jgi:hypothetical protein
VRILRKGDPKKNLQRRSLVEALRRLAQLLVGTKEVSKERTVVIPGLNREIRVRGLTLRQIATFLKQCGGDDAKLERLIVMSGMVEPAVRTAADYECLCDPAESRICRDTGGDP